MIADVTMVAKMKSIEGIYMMLPCSVPIAIRAQQQSFRMRSVVIGMREDSLYVCH